VKTASKKTAAARAAKAQEKEEADQVAQRKAEVESARVRAMFDEDRQRFARRYGVVSTASRD
jgi:hypothetical protein